MRYNEKNSEQIGERNIIPKLLDDNTIVEVSAQIMCDVQGKIQANYDLIVYGDIDVSSLTVMGNLICFGNCKAKNMNVQGSCDIYGNLEVQDGLLSDTLRAREVVIDSLEVKGKVICDTLDCQGHLVGHNKVLAADGIMGSGELDCDLILCGEYAFADDNDNIFVANEIEEKLSNIQPQVKQEDPVVDIESMDWDDCKEYLKKLSERHPEYKADYDAYIELEPWSELTKLKSINQYIELTELLTRNVELYRKSDLYRVVKEDLWNKTDEYVFELKLISVSQDDFSRLLYITMLNRESIPASTYEYIRELLFNRIGLKYSTVVRMLGE